MAGDVAWREAEEHAAHGVGQRQKSAERNDGAPGGWVGPTEEPGQAHRSCPHSPGSAAPTSPVPPSCRGSYAALSGIGSEFEPSSESARPPKAFSSSFIGRA